MLLILIVPLNLIKIKVSLFLNVGIPQRQSRENSIAVIVELSRKNIIKTKHLFSSLKLSHRAMNARFPRFVFHSLKSDKLIEIHDGSQPVFGISYLALITSEIKENQKRSIF